MLSPSPTIGTYFPGTSEVCYSFSSINLKDNSFTRSHGKKSFCRNSQSQFSWSQTVCVLCMFSARWSLCTTKWTSAMPAMHRSTYRKARALCYKNKINTFILHFLLGVDLVSLHVQTKQTVRKKNRVFSWTEKWRSNLLHGENWTLLVNLRVKMYIVHCQL